MRIRKDSNKHFISFLDWFKNGDVRVKVYVASVTKTRYCQGPNAEPGKIKTDPQAHLSDCLIRKKLSSGRFTRNTFVTPRECDDGYGLGLAVSS
jgi:hypothetical protein